jgi:hypothetical protein
MRGSPRPVLLSSLPAAILAVALVAAPAAASHDVRAYELDANAADSGASGDDWSTVVPTDHSTTAIVSSFVDDRSNPPSDTSYFTGGGSKDLNDVPAWAHTTGDVAPDKNEITHAFAVAYRSTRDTGRTNVGDLLVYFGLDRYANNGDAQVGFWFFRGSVGMASGGGFSGSHRDGDVLVLSHFTQGGRVSDINVYEWVGSGGSDGTLDLLMNGRECSAAGADDAACAIVNQSSTPAAWSYTPKAGSGGVFPQGSFYEGGINLTRLAGVRCLKSFMAETRSSQSVTAQLKDLALGPFDTCPVTTVSGPIRPVPVTSHPPLAATGKSDTVPFAVLGVLLVGVGVGLRGESARRIAFYRTVAAARSAGIRAERCSGRGWATSLRYPRC